MDTRAREAQDKHLDSSKPQGLLDDDFDDSGNYLNEKQSHLALNSERSPTSPDSSLGAGFSPISPAVASKSLHQLGFAPKSDEKAIGEPPPVPPEQRICGLRRKRFWELFAVILAILVAAAVIGGVVGGLRARNGGSSSSSAAASSSPNSTNPNNSTALAAL